MNLVLTDNHGKQYPVMVIHWWPDREYQDFDPRWHTPFRVLIHKARRDGSPYLTYAECQTPAATFTGDSRCMSIDPPNRKYGYNRAVGLLKQAALRHGYEMQVMHADGSMTEHK